MRELNWRDCIFLDDITAKPGLDLNSLDSFSYFNVGEDSTILALKEMSKQIGSAGLADLWLCSVI